jgi:hypothetical protein
MAWLHEVGGHLFRSGPDARGRSAWVAVVRTPPLGAARGKLIIAMGESLEEAAAAAETRWRILWNALGPIH